MSHIGDRIRARRLQAGLSQKALGQLCGVGGTMIIHWEQGRRKPPLQRAKKIADALFMEVGDLIGDDEGADYLVTRSDVEKRWLRLFRTASPAMRDKLLRFVSAALQTRLEAERRPQVESIEGVD